MWKRHFPYEQYNKWSRDPAEKRRWTEALEKWGPTRVEPELSDRALGSSARINIGETRGVVVGFIRDGLALLWQILSGTGFPNQFFNDSWVVGFGGADHGWQDAELERRT